MSVAQHVLEVPRVLMSTAYARCRRIRLAGLVKFNGRFPLIVGGSRMTFGRRVVIGGRLLRVQLSTSSTGSLRLGDNSFVNQGSSIHSDVRIVIGDRVRIGDFCAIYDTNFHESTPGGGVRRGPVEIGDDVWLGRAVIVLPGTTLGQGCVVSAGSVVRGQFPPRSRLRGNPAVVVERGLRMESSPDATSGT